MQDLTTGSLTRHLLTTTSYMLVTMVFQTLYFLIDLYWVGRLGKEAVAAVAIAGNLTFIVLAATQMLGVGTTTLVSHATGRKDRDSALIVFNQSQVLSLVVGVLFLAVGMATRDAYSESLAADAATARLASAYLGWFIPAMALQFAMVAMGAALRGTGNFKPGMVVSTATVIINMLLAPFLIFGWAGAPALGVAGAALSSFVAVAIGVVWLGMYFRSGESYLHFRHEQWTPRLDLWSRMLKVGLPAGAEFALTAVAMFIIYSVSRRFGSAAQAGFGISIRIVQACFLPVVALGFAVAPVAGQNFGARKASRVRSAFRSAALMAAGVMLATGVLCYLAPDRLVGIFADDPAVIAVGVEYFRIVSFSFVASGVVFVSSSTFQAVGNTVPPLVTSFARVLAFAIPTIILSQQAGFELLWVWYLSATAIVVQMAANLLLLRREFRLRLNFEPARSQA